MRDKILLLIIGVVAGLILSDFVKHKDVETKIVTKTEVEYVPVEVPVKTTEYIKVEVPVPTRVKEDSVELNKYQGFQETQFGKLHYDISTIGSLEQFSFRPDFSVTTFVPQTTTTVEKTVIKKPAGLFITGSLNRELAPAVGLTFIKDRTLVSLSTNSVTIGYRLR